MCRIFGFIKNDQIDISNEKLELAKICQLKGGPDQQVIFRSNENIALCNNRLSLQDIDLGGQPFVFSHISVVFNGEIYNHNELSSKLKEKGYKLKTNCDGEIIPYLYLEYGVDFVKYLNGMFAIALYDSEQKKIILCNDHLAIKSLYFFKNQDIFCFSSDIRGIYHMMPEAKEIDFTNIDHYLVGRAILGNKTFYNNIFVMKPSQIIIIDENINVEIDFYQTSIKSNYILLDLNEFAIHLNYLIENELSKMLKVDVKPCIVLSGGLDSTYIAALMSRQIDGLEAFHVCYECDWKNDEKSYAKLACEKFGIKYNEVVIKKSDIIPLLYEMIENLGVPNAAPHALSAYALYKNINHAGFKIAFAGEGSDEIFCGYKRFSDAIFDSSKDWVENYFSAFSINDLKEIRKYYNKEFAYEFNNSYDVILNNSLKDIKNPELRIKKLIELEQNERFPNYILRRVDHLSMAFALEIRVPFCQPKIQDFASNLPTNFKLERENQKKILFKAAKNIVPSEILNRTKQPFTMPFLEMIDSNARNQIKDIISNNIYIKKYFNTNLLLEDFLCSKDKKQLDTIWAILVFGL